MDRRQILGILGAVLLFMGTFAPIISLPIVGTINYFRNGQGDGIIIIMFVATTLILTLTKNYRALWVPGVGSLGLLAFTFINFQMKMSETKAQMARELAGNPFRGFAEVAAQSVQLQWGWAILVVGALLVISAAALNEKREGDDEQAVIDNFLLTGDSRKSLDPSDQDKDFFRPRSYLGALPICLIICVLPSVVMISVVNMVFARLNI